MKKIIIGAMFATLPALVPAHAMDTLAPSDADLFGGIPTILIKGDSAVDTTDEQLVSCRKKFSQTLSNLLSRAYVIVQKRECAMNGNVSGSISFLR